MSNLTYKGNQIGQRDEDNFVNLTQMAKANGVEVKHFNESEFAKNYLKALQESIGRESRLMTVEGFGANKATWVHPLVAIAFGQWISPEFHVWCNQNIQTLMTEGTVSLPQATPQRQLPQRDAVEYINAAKDIETINNLGLQELLRMNLVNELSVLNNQKQLPAKTTQYTIVSVRAKELGYSTAEIGNGAELGRFIGKNVPVAFNERVGKYRVNHYEVNDQLDTAIKTYFGMKHSLSV